MQHYQRPAHRSRGGSTKRKTHATLADMPEEILERILALVLVQSAEASPRPSWHPYQTPPPTSPTVISPLLVCRAWLRIATPIHYRHPVLRTPRHVELLLRALRHTPMLASCVRSLHLHATSPALRDLIPLCPNLDTLDITVDNADGPQLPVTRGVVPAEDGTRDRGVIEFCEAFTKTRGVRHLVVRKNAYLTQPNAIYIFEQLAKAITTRWYKLETVDVAFRLSPSPAASALTKALAAAPRLHTVCTQLPAVWNTTLLDIAQNPALTRIVLSPTPELAGAHLFLAEAKRHPRLVDLLRAGSPPPSPHPTHAGIPFSLAGSARARAASTAVAVTGNAPMPVATWGYDRDVPPPTCPPVRRSAHSAQGASGSIVGPSAYRAPVPAPSTSYPGPGLQYGQQFTPAQHHLAVNYAGQSYARGNPQYHSSAAARMPGPQPSIVSVQGPGRRSTPGGRRMTAS